MGCKILQDDKKIGVLFFDVLRTDRDTHRVRVSEMRKDKRENTCETAETMKSVSDDNTNKNETESKNKSAQDHDQERIQEQEQKHKQQQDQEQEEE